MAIRRPVVGAACATVGGMLLAASGIIPISLFIFISFFLLLACMLLPRARCAPIIFLLVACVAGARFLLSDNNLSGRSVSSLEGMLPIDDIAVVGRVSGFPEFHPYRSGSQGSWSYPVELDAVGISNVWKTCRGTINVRQYGAMTDPPVVYGRRAEFSGSLEKSLFPGKARFTLRTSDAEVIPLSGGPFFSPSVVCRSWRDSAAQHLERDIEMLPVQQSILKALVLGLRNDIPHETMACFQRTGSIHIFAISGLHVGIVGLLLVLILKSAGIPRDWFGVLLLPLLLFYVASTGMKPSALRALTMAAVYLLAPLFRCRPDIPSSVAFAGMLLLLIRPLELMSAGFVFSFTVVVFIVMAFSKVPRRWLEGGVIRSYTVSLAVTSFAAGLASMPLTALYFGTFSPIALVGNLVVVPLTFCIVLSGWLSILIPVAAAIFNHAAVFFINLLLVSVQWLDRLPGSSWQVQPPSLPAVLFWYASLIYLLTHARSRTEKICAVCGAGCAVLFAVVS